VAAARLLPPLDNGDKGRKIGTGDAKPPKGRQFGLPEPGQTALSLNNFCNMAGA